MKLSIVSTLYNSSDFLSEFHARSTSAAKAYSGDAYEIVLVNDGSPDDSLLKAIALSEIDPHVIVVDLSRNFGHHHAMMAGMEYSRGEHVFLLDCDLEESPEWLSDFGQDMSDKDCDVVFGVQASRKGGPFEKWSGELYYWMLKHLVDIDHPKNVLTVRLMSRRYVDALLQHRESEIVISFLWVITGFMQHPRAVEKKSRGKTNYTLFKKLSHAVNTVTSFSSRPLVYIFFTGIWIFIASMAYVTYLIINRLIFSAPVDGWTSVIASIWLLGGITISFIGVIGIYIVKIFKETKARPNIIVRSVHGTRSKN